MSASTKFKHGNLRPLDDGTHSQPAHKLCRLFQTIGFQQHMPNPNRWAQIFVAHFPASFSDHSRTGLKIPRCLQFHRLTLTRPKRKLAQVMCLHDNFLRAANLDSEPAVYNLAFTYDLFAWIIR